MNGKWHLMQLTGRGGSGTSKMITIETEVSDIPGLESRRISAPLEKGKILIKTIKVIPNKEAAVSVQILTSVLKPENESIYANDSKHSTGNDVEGIYDMMDLPYNDEDNSNQIHFDVQNKSMELASFKIKVVGLAMT